MTEEVVQQTESTPDTPPDKDARTWAMVCHLTALSGYCIPFGNVVVPLIIWVIKKDDSPFVDDQGKEAINFQLTITIAALVSFALIFILIGFFLLAVLFIYQIVMIIVASVQAYDGVEYRYPYTIRFFK